MKVFVITLVAVSVALAAAVPAKPYLHADFYRNTLTARTSRVVGGEIATRHQFPYQVSLRWSFAGIILPLCGGTLIKKNWVLTAAHCKVFSFGTYEVELGLLQQNEIHDDVQLIEVEEFIVHSGYPRYYSDDVAADDIALLKLKTPANLTEAVQLAPLPAEDECDALEDADLSGWGLTSSDPVVSPVDLMWARLPRISNSKCADDLIAIVGDAEPLDDTMICTGSNERKIQSACSGDSGGPLFSVSLKKVIGVVSWGVSPCGIKGAPSVYTKVCSHLDFINSNINN